MDLFFELFVTRAVVYSAQIRLKLPYSSRTYLPKTSNITLFVTNGNKRKEAKL